MSAQINEISTTEEEQLRQQLLSTREQLSHLEHDLGQLDAELDGLGEQRESYQMLEQACVMLERLEEQGVAELFWGANSEGRTEAHIRDVRDRAGDYLRQITDIERRRESVTDQIKRGQDVLDILHGDLYEIQLAREEAASEWVVERELTETPRMSVMPWSGTDDNQRLRKSMSTSLLVALLLGVIVPLIKLPLPDLELIPEVPDRFAKLIEQELPPPPPPPPIVEEVVPDEAVEPEPEPVVAEQEPEVTPPTPEEPAPTVVEEAAPEREVRSAGILAFSESFASLADSRPEAQLGAQARINTAGADAVGRTERSMVTSQAPGSSGGINLASLSRDVGGAGGAGDQIGGVEVTRVASSIGVSGNGDRPLAAGAAAGRTDEEIQLVFDRYKSALYRLYNRELRIDPTLRGQVVLNLTIEPDGSVSYCVVQSSDLGAPALEQQIVERVLSFDFGAKEGITAVTILYPIDFLPAG